MSSQLPSIDPALKDRHSVSESFLQRYVSYATDGIVKLWDESKGTFWRSTAHRNSKIDASVDFFPTASLRCIDALLSLISEFQDWILSDIRKSVIEEVVPRIVSHEHTKLKTSLNVKGNGTQPLNLFTLSLYIQTFSAICRLQLLPDEEVKNVRAKLDKAISDLLGHAAYSGSGAGKQLYIHPFLLYHSCRALSSFMLLQPSKISKQRCNKLLGRIKASVRRSIERLIARNKLASLNPSECVASAFCAATLALSLTDEDWQYARVSIELCFDSQDTNGCWPLGRIVREDKTHVNERLEISTYEIAAIVAETLGRLAEEGNEHLASGLGAESVNRMIQAGRYIERSAVRLNSDKPPNVGWCTEHVYDNDVIQSWTCATVLQSLLNLAKLIEQADRQRILTTFAHVSPRDADWPSWRRWDTYRIESEIDHKHCVLQYLHEKVVEPVLKSPRRLPNRNPSSASVLLFGPPGTSKTTIVKAVADGLKWPVVLLSPGDFIQKGLEYIEAQAISVFERLMFLSRSVVIFDECDELFRDRAPSPATEQTRGITAFVTASMLPKLQELHDRGRVIFFICTNNFNTIDPAIKRGGRIDHIIGIGPPDKSARSKIANDTFEDLKSQKEWVQPKYFEFAIKRLILKTERFTRSEIQRAVRILAKATSWESKKGAEANADNILEDLNTSLIIDKKVYEKYVKTNKEFSHPLSQGVPHE